MNTKYGVLTPHMDRALGSFQNSVARSITGRQPRWIREGIWEYPLLAAAMEEAGFEDIGFYITRKQNTVAQYIAKRPILELYERSIWRLGY